MDEALRQLVRQRANLLGEYCLVPMLGIAQKFAIDHIIARQHGGPTTADNLANICQHCNQHKGPNVAGIDPVTRQLARLFNPRRDRWDEHFRVVGVEIIGITDVGRVTVVTLAMNDEWPQAVRTSLVAENLYPPQQG
jgi:hypothetical protein